MKSPELLTGKTLVIELTRFPVVDGYMSLEAVVALLVAQKCVLVLITSFEHALTEMEITVMLWSKFH